MLSADFKVKNVSWDYMAGINWRLVGEWDG